jgi:hypothetical protein
MGIFESLTRRSAGSVDAIVNAIGQAQKQKQLEANTARLRELLMGGGQDMGANEPTESITPAVAATSMQPVSIPKTSIPNIASSLSSISKGRGSMGMRGLGEMNMDEVLGMGDILRETPELSPQVQMLQQAIAARKPKRTFMNQERGGLDVITEDPSGGYSVKRELEPWQDTGKQDKGNYMRSGQFVHDVFQQGDLPYEKPAREPQPNPETIRHNKETESLSRTKETEDTKNELQRLTEEAEKLGSANVNLGKGLSEDGKMMLYDPDSDDAQEQMQLIKDKITKNEDRIAQIKGTIDQTRKNRGWLKGQKRTQEEKNNNSYSIQEIRDTYPNLKNKTDEEIIDAYGKQGIAVSK